MGDVEQLRIDLDKFCSTEENNQNKFENIPTTLETVLIKIASNGEMPFDFEWKQISQLVKRKILFCIDSMNTKAQYQPAEEYTDSCDLLLQRMEMFTEAPFTIQRICELILEPEKYYKNTNKYIHALLKCLLVVSGWRKQAESDLPKEEPAKEIKSDENVEPDSTSDQQPQSKPQKNESKPEADDEQNVQPDSTTTDKIINNVTETTEVQNEEFLKNESSGNEDGEPVFLERPIRKTEEDEGEGIFGEKTAGSPVKRKIKIAQTNIQINIGNGKSGPDDESSNKPTAQETSPSEENETSDSKTDTPMDENSEDEEKRKRKRSIGADDEVETELKESPPTPTKLQKTE